MKKLLILLFILLSFNSYSQITIQANSSTSLITNDLLDLEAITVEGFSYSWNGPGGLSSEDEYLYGIVTSANSGIYTVTATDGENTSTSTIAITVTACSVINAKVLLSGCYNVTSGLMYDSLRTYGLIPNLDPYGSGSSVDPSVFVFTGPDAIVDWIKLELRSSSNSSTILYTKSALVQRNGNIVDLDGVSYVRFTNAPIGTYYLSVKHRNHLGVMKASTITTTESGVSIDFTNPSTILYSRSSPYNNPSPLTGATRVQSGKLTLYAGNGYKNETNQIVSYGGYGDRQVLLKYTGLSGSISGYSNYDYNMNGRSNYNYPVNTASDRYTLFLNCANNLYLKVYEQLP
jgi:hypothetical protein